MNKQACVLAALLVSHGLTVLGQESFVPVTNFAKNGNIQTGLIKEFPTGLWTATNSLATPFNIVSDGTNNFSQISTSLTVNVFLPGVDHVYTLMNAYAPNNGTVATVEFLGDRGGDQIFTLTGGVNVRDFYKGSFINTINGTTTVNAFSVFGVRDAGGTGNVSTGLTGDYVVDEQVFALNPVFLNQNLVQIKVSGANNGTPIVLGITASVAKPGLTGISLSGTNATLTGIGGTEGRPYYVLTTTNLVAPFSQWTRLATNIMGTSGNFSILVTNQVQAATKAQFFELEFP